jgi:hypothetical protein
LRRARELDSRERRKSSSYSRSYPNTPAAHPSSFTPGPPHPLQPPMSTPGDFSTLPYPATPGKPLQSGPEYGPFPVSKAFTDGGSGPKHLPGPGLNHPGRTPYHPDHNMLELEGRMRDLDMGRDRNLAHFNGGPSYNMEAKGKNPYDYDLRGAGQYNWGPVGPQGGKPMGPQDGGPSGARSGGPSGARSGGPSGAHGGEPMGPYAGGPSGAHGGEQMGPYGGRPQGAHGGAPKGAHGGGPMGHHGGEPMGPYGGPMGSQGGGPMRPQGGEPMGPQGGGPMRSQGGGPMGSQGGGPMRPQGGGPMGPQGGGPMGPQGGGPMGPQGGPSKGMGGMGMPKAGPNGWDFSEMGLPNENVGPSKGNARLSKGFGMKSNHERYFDEQGDFGHPDMGGFASQPRKPNTQGLPPNQFSYEGLPPQHSKAGGTRPPPNSHSMPPDQFFDSLPANPRKPGGPGNSVHEGPFIPSKQGAIRSLNELNSSFPPQAFPSQQTYSKNQFPDGPMSGGYSPYGSGMPGNPQLMGYQQQPQAPPGFRRPVGGSQSFRSFDPLKIQDMDAFYEHIPRMPMILQAHDVQHEDWIRCMQVCGIYATKH